MPWRVVFASLLDHVNSLVTWPVYDLYGMFRNTSMSMACILCCRSAVLKVRVSEAHRNFEKSSTRICLILFFTVILLFFHIGFSLAGATEAYAILERRFLSFLRQRRTRYFRFLTVSFSHRRVYVLYVTCVVIDELGFLRAYAHLIISKGFVQSF